MLTYHKSDLLNSRDVVLPYVSKIILNYVGISRKLLEKLSKCRNTTRLTMIKAHISKFPKEVLNMSYLTHLKMSNNWIKTLPKEIYRLTELKFLEISSSKLTTILPGISRLYRLECLIINNNNLSDFPEDFFDLGELKYLEINDNKFTELSENMCYLTSLVGLNISGNKIDYLFDGIDNLVNLKEISLLRTLIKTIPDNFCFISRNCELIIDCDLIMNNLPLELEYMTVTYITPRINNRYKYSPLKLDNLPTGLLKLYITSDTDIKNSKLGLNTEIIPFDNDYYYGYHYISWGGQHQINNYEDYYENDNYHENDYESYEHETEPITYKKMTFFI